MSPSTEETTTGRAVDNMGSNTCRARRRVANLLLGAILVFFCWDVLCVNAQGTVGEFISIDCGNSASYKDSLGILWSSDSKYISTGKNTVVNTSAANLGTDHSQNVQKLRTVRYFPEVRSKHCYIIPEVLKNSMYLIRVMFLGANFTSTQNQIVSFGLTVSNYDWTEVTISDSYTPLIKEVTFTTGAGPLSLCLVQGVGTPFISSLELRHLPDWYYQGTGLPFAAYQNVLRWNCGTAPTTPSIRYPNDRYDRLWGPDPASFHFNRFSNSSAVIGNSTRSTYGPPATVMQSAWTAPLTESLNFTWPVPVDSVFLIAFLYFAEIASVPKHEVRELEAYMDGELLSAPILVNATPSMVFNYSLSSLNISISPAKGSTLGAILNAVEVYSIDFFSNTYTTYEPDVEALAAIQQSFNLTDWTGDPCLPVAWDWVQCSSPNTTAVSRVQKIVLSNYNITGTIPAEIVQLQELVDLSLNNNNLTGDISSLTFPTKIQTLLLEDNHLEGSIPESLALLPNLHVLNLDNNMLSGDVPLGLLAKIQNNSLMFTASGNPNLCFGSSSRCAPVLTPSSPSKGNGTVGSSSGKSSSSVGIIVGAIAGAVAVLLLLAGLFFYLARRGTSTSKPDAYSDPAGVVHKEHPPQAKSFSLMEVKAATDNFSRVIGKGGFGLVYYGKLADGQKVAVKVNKGNTVNAQGTEEFWNEVALVSRVHHRNLVSLLGYCDELDQQMLIYAYMSEGPLRAHLYGETKSGVPLDWRTRLDIGLNAARGLEYLHNSCSPPMIHRDVRSSNILLTHKLLAKVTDFGISKITTEKDRSRGIATQIKGTHGYLDPEYFKEHKLTTKSDVYSFGIVLLELVTGRKPTGSTFPGSAANSLQDWVRHSAREGNIHGVIDPQLAGEYNLESMWKVVEIALLSVDQHGAKRPDMKEIVQELTEALELHTHHIQAPMTGHSPSQLAPGDFDKYQRVQQPARNSGSLNGPPSAKHSWRNNGKGGRSFK